MGILGSTVFFCLEHIHVFQASWLVQFIQTQFFHVFLFGIFSGYLFFKSKGNIWSVFSMHAFTNAFSGSVPIVVTHAFPFTFYIAEIVSFTILILLLHYLLSQVSTTAMRTHSINKTDALFSSRGSERYGLLHMPEMLQNWQRENGYLS